MKFLIGFSFLTSSALSFGAQNSSINDLQYLPSKGTIFGTTHGVLHKETLNRPAFTRRTTGYELQQTVGYALAENFSLAAGLNYLTQEREISGSTVSSRRGLSDPSFNAKYRLIDGATKLDLLGNFRASVGDHEYKGINQNNLNGGHSFDVGAQYGGVTESIQWAVSAVYSRNLKATSVDSSNNSTKIDSYKTYQFAGELLTRLTERSFIKGLVGVNFQDSYKDNGGGYSNAMTIYRLGAEYQHVCSKNLFVKAGFENRVVNFHSEDVDRPMYYVGANYQF